MREPEPRREPCEIDQRHEHRIAISAVLALLDPNIMRVLFRLVFLVSLACASAATATAADATLFRIFLRAGGVLVTPTDPMNRNLADKAEEAGVRFAGIMVEPDHVALESLADLVDDGRLRVHLERTFGFDDIAEAHRYVEGGHMTGKVVLVP